MDEVGLTVIVVEDVGAVGAGKDDADGQEVWQERWKKHERCYDS